METTMNSVEKLIQMATIEHMYIMLNRLKENNITNIYKESSSCCKENSSYNECLDSNKNSEVINKLTFEITCLKTEIHNTNQRLSRTNDEYFKLYTKFSDIERELLDIKSNTNNKIIFFAG